MKAPVTEADVRRIVREEIAAAMPRVVEQVTQAACQSLSRRRIR
jgi:hypothetical protein